MKSLLIGCAGQLGRELLRTLGPLGQIIGADLSPQKILGIPAVRLDLTRPDEVQTIVRDVKPNLIINAAAYTLVDQAEADEDRAMSVNGTAPGFLAEEARKLGAGLIHFSTDYVFNGEGVRPWTEEDRPSPINAYGRSKWVGEKAVGATGVPHLIFRLAWLYGVYGANFVKTVLNMGTHKPMLKVVTDQVGAPTCARFVAQVIAQIVAQGLPNLTAFLKEKGGTYHLTCQGEASRYECASEIFRLARLHGMTLTLKSLEAVSSAEFKMPAARPLNCRLDCRRIQDVFGIRPIPWDSALALSFPDIMDNWLMEQRAVRMVA